MARPSRSAPYSPATSPCPIPNARPGPRSSRRSSAAWPAPTGRRSVTSPTALRCWTSWPGPGTRRWPRWAPPARTTSCAPRCAPMVLDLPPSAPLDRGARPARASCTPPTATTTGPTTSGTPTPDSPPMRGADPAIVLVPGVGMFSFGADKQTARVAGEFYVNAINVMRGAEAVSTYSPIPSGRSSASSTGSWKRPSCAAGPSRSRWPPGWRWSPAAAPASAGPPRERLAAEGACVVVADRDAAAAEKVAAAIGTVASTAMLPSRSPRT